MWFLICCLFCTQIDNVLTLINTLSLERIRYIAQLIILQNIPGIVPMQGLLEWRVVVGKSWRHEFGNGLRYTG